MLPTLASYRRHPQHGHDGRSRRSLSGSGTFAQDCTTLTSVSPRAKGGKAGLRRPLIAIPLCLMNVTFGALPRYRRFDYKTTLCI